MSQIKKEFQTILDRKENAEEGSYTGYLFNKGKEKILKKVGEECTEVVIASMANKKEELIGEICDLTFHMLVLMAEDNITLDDIENELKKRSEKSNNFKGERREITNF
ncbi:MAG: phosphoribosyl-ATP diphosphatase [Clostridiales bacterium]|nr:phosphoribosyl-ATP diphosphatase [Clostridiales bacterium]